jgi:hypothetical protein
MPCQVLLLYRQRSPQENATRTRGPIHSPVHGTDHRHLSSTSSPHGRGLPAQLLCLPILPAVISSKLSIMAEISDGPLEDRDATSHLASKSSRSSPINANATPTNPPDVLMTEDSTTILDDSTFPPTEKTQPDESTPPKMGDSQPMTASSSSSSHPSLRESGTSGTAAPAPYGTRSRNRTAGSRPNYAEDKEMEMEYECTGATGNPNVASKPALQVEEPQSENTQPQKISGVSTRRAAASTTNSQGSSNGVLNQASANPKEPIPGLSSFPVISTTGTTTGSKKRKAGASNGTTGTSASSGPGQVTTRRTSMAVGNSSHGRLTNMLSFEMSQGYLKHGKLKADDGTTLAVNGEQLPTFQITSQASLSVSSKCPRASCKYLTRVLRRIPV